jgi:hypothetical protein
MNMQTLHTCGVRGGTHPQGETEARPEGARGCRLPDGRWDDALVAQADRSP